MNEDKEQNVRLITAEPLPRLKQARHSWFGLPELSGYLTFMICALIVYNAIAPAWLPRLLSHWPVVSYRVENAVESPTGLVSLYLVRKKLRRGTPEAIEFFVQNDLTAKSEDLSPVLPFRGNEDCTAEIANDNLSAAYNHEINEEWYSHFCFKLLRHVDLDQHFTLSGRLTHSAWPFIVPIVLNIKPFQPQRVDHISYPYSVPLNELTKSTIRPHS